MKDFETFKHQNFGELRVVVYEQDNSIWFISVDVTNALLRQSDGTIIRKAVPAAEIKKDVINGVAKNNMATLVSRNGIVEFAKKLGGSVAPLFVSWIDEVSAKIEKDRENEKREQQRAKENPAPLPSSKDAEVERAKRLSTPVCDDLRDIKRKIDINNDLLRSLINLQQEMIKSWK